MVDHRKKQLNRDLARQCVCRFLSLALADPRSKRWERLLERPFQDAVSSLSEVIRLDPCARIQPLAPGELPLSELNPAPAIKIINTSQESILLDHQRIFGLLVSKECPPYETEYCPQTFSVYRSQKLADVAGFYRAFGVEPSHDMPDRHDHISLELEFMSWLVAKERYAMENDQGEGARVCRSAQQRFFKEHLAWWAPAFACALLEKASGITGGTGKSFYGAVSKVLSAFVAVERAFLGVKPPTELVSPTLSSDAGSSCDSCGLQEGA